MHAMCMLCMPCMHLFSAQCSCRCNYNYIPLLGKSIATQENLEAQYCGMSKILILCLVLVQPRKTSLDITEKLLSWM